MQAGRLNRRIVIKQRGTAQDAIGQPVETWTTVATLYAEIKHPAGLTAIKGDADVSIVKASIRIRYRTDIDAGMRAEHGAAIYDIKAVLPDEAGRKHVDLVCERASV